jgi:HEAT repeat protein
VTIALSQGQENELTPIDSLPTTQQLDLVFQGQALAELSAIAGAEGNDIGVRLRAIHALVNYCTAPCAVGDTAHDTLASLVTANADVLSGSDLLVLRAAIEALGPLEVATDVNLLSPLLNHPSRDIRATTADALRDLCNTSAIEPLRVRYSEETVEQVELAISEALRLLAEPPCSGPT